MKESSHASGYSNVPDSASEQDLHGLMSHSASQDSLGIPPRAPSPAVASRAGSHQLPESRQPAGSSFGGFDDGAPGACICPRSCQLLRPMLALGS